MTNMKVLATPKEVVMRELEVYEDICAADFRFINAAPCEIQPVLDELEAEGALKPNGYFRKKHAVYVKA